MIMCFIMKMFLYTIWLDFIINTFKIKDGNNVEGNYWFAAEKNTTDR